MTLILVRRRNGEDIALEATDDLSIMQNIRNSGIDDIEALCSGCASCGTCHVYVDDVFLPLLPQQADNEDALLDTLDHRAANSRLSCQILVEPGLEGLKLTIAPKE